MAIGYSTSIRNSQLDAVTAAIDGGAGAGKLRIYDGVRPSTGSAPTTLLAELTFTDPAAPAAAAGVLTFSAITQDSSADASGTATWARIVDSGNNFVMDMDVGTSGSDINLNTVNIVAGGIVSVVSGTITAGNA